ncbi:MAG TPA: hypothetical protein VLE97_08890 [Gaiellaceae bacterium]|nr:hypothetical protein [Gaiellaceae bacterium]
MTKSKKLRVLREIYAGIPEVHCQGLCVAQCSTVPVAPIELDALERAAGRPLNRSASDLGFTMLGEIAASCELLVLGRCTAYAARPAICRVFGAAEGIRCPHGCEPDRVMTNEEAASVFAAVEAL